MIEKINEEIIKSRKAKDSFRTTVLGSVKAELVNNEKTAKPKKDIDVISSYRKKLAKGIKAYPEDNPIRESLSKEIQIISEFLPEEMTEDALREVVSGVIEKLGKDNFGAIVGTTMKIVQRQADGSVVSKIVKELLA